MVALLGSSGCGKTTLLRSIAGFVEPSSGAIRIEGRDLLALPPEKRGAAMMFQSYALWPHMSVAANIGYGLRMRGWKREAIAQRVEEMLALLQLEGYGARSVGALSGGQRQRVALGRALAVSPSLLLLDEPMSNLDYRVRVDLRHELRSLQKRIGITAVYVTHDREEALTLADRIAVIDAGRIAQYGTPRGGLPPARLARSSPASWAPTTGSRSRSATTARSRCRRPRPRARRVRAHFRADDARLVEPEAAGGPDEVSLSGRRRPGLLRRPGLSLPRAHGRRRSVGPRRGAAQRGDAGGHRRAARVAARLPRAGTLTSRPSIHAGGGQMKLRTLVAASAAALFATALPAAGQTSSTSSPPATRTWSTT